MRKAHKGEAAQPWDQPGFKFYTDDLKRFCKGYVPTVAEDMLAGRSLVRDREAASKSRNAQIENGTGWGGGSIQGLSKRADALLKRPKKKEAAA